MFCWSCGHENLDTQKFCGDCGKSLFKPEKVVTDFTPKKSLRDTSALAEKAPVEPAVKPAVPSAPPGTMLAAPVPPPSNPLIEEPRVVHEDPIAAAILSAPPQPPTPIRERVPNRITGPSFLGLSDDPNSQSSDETSYLLEDDTEPPSPWRGYVAVALLIIASLLVIRYWGDVRVIASDYAQKMGASDSPKPATGPQRVTSGNDSSQSASADASHDASKLTPDAAPEENKAAAPADHSKSNDSQQQTAKLEKPQSDDEATASKNETKASPEKATPAPAEPAYDNSQLEEAQKYLQGRGVQQDCNRGIDLLRSAAKQPNPKARIQMAALYASGHCVTADMAEAYNWFARAQELEPRNKLIEKNLDSLWTRMSDEDRRRVLR